MKRDLISFGKTNFLILQPTNKVTSTSSLVDNLWRIRKITFLALNSLPSFLTWRNVLDRFAINYELTQILKNFSLIWLQYGISEIYKSLQDFFIISCTFTRQKECLLILFLPYDFYLKACKRYFFSIIYFCIKAFPRYS